MELLVSQPNNHIIAHAVTDNPYQARNFLAHHLTPRYDLIDPHTLQTAFGLIIRATPELIPLLQPKPQVLNEIPFTKPQDKPTPSSPQRSKFITLREICFEIKVEPIIARRILRKHFGANNIRYEWTPPEVPTIKELLTCRM